MYLFETRIQYSMKVKFLPLALTLCSLVFHTISNAQPTLTFTRYLSALDNPVAITNAGDERLFIVEQKGIITWVKGTSITEQGEFLDIDARVRSGGERGLLGLAFHPDYTNNGYFYVNYTNNSGHTVISRFSVNADDANRADPDSEKILLTQDQPFSNHNGGDLAFGPDGYLYIGLGDGGSGGDPQNNAQNHTTFLGKMLRIDVDNGDPYAIPADNPFAEEDFTLDEIWSLGWRNPWRFSFDRETGDMWVGDVGQDAWEEIDFEPTGTGGLNYGWRCYEGNADFNQGNDCPDESQMTFPVHQYPKPNNGCISVTGGYVYRGAAFANLQGRYIYGDFCTGQFWSIMPDGTGGFINEELSIEGGGNFQPSSFGEDQNGELYMADFSSGAVYRIGTTCPINIIIANVTNETCGGDADGAIDVVSSSDFINPTFAWSTGATTEDLTNLEMGTYSLTITGEDGCLVTSSFTVTNNEYEVPVEIIANGAELSTIEGEAAYQWYLNGEIIMGANAPTYTAMVSGDYYVEVSNNAGCSTFTEIVNVMVSSTFSIAGLEQINISPNPFQDIIQLEIITSQRLNLKMELLNVEGKTLKKWKKNIRGTYRNTLDLNDLENGIYFLQIKNKKGKMVQQLIK